MSKKKGEGAGRPRSNVSPGADYAQWLMLVPKGKRYEVAKFVTGCKLETYDDLIKFNVGIMAALMEGRITPIIAAELRHWHELNFSVIAAKNSSEGPPQDAYTDVITALVQVKREAKKIRGDYFDVEEPIVVEPEKVAMKGEGS